MEMLSGDVVSVLHLAAQAVDVLSVGCNLSLSGLAAKKKFSR